MSRDCGSVISVLTSFSVLIPCSPRCNSSFSKQVAIRTTQPGKRHKFVNCQGIFYCVEEEMGLLSAPLEIVLILAFLPVLFVDAIVSGVYLLSCLAMVFWHDSFDKAFKFVATSQLPSLHKEGGFTIPEIAAVSS